MNHFRLVAIQIALAWLTGCTPNQQLPLQVTSHRVSTITLDVHEDERLALFLMAYHASRNRAGERLRGYTALTEEDRLTLDRHAEEFAPLEAAFEPYHAIHPGLSAELGVIGANLTGGEYDGADSVLIAALDAFMPVYRREFAERHKAITAKYAVKVRQELARHGDAMAQAISREVAADWRGESIRVDIVPYVTFLGAYTNPHHTVITAMSQDYRDHALEMVFHEAAHTSPMDDALKAAADAALARHDLKNPRFWHYLQFYAIGRAAQQVLGDQYVPYHKATGLSQRAGAEYYAAIEEVWDSYSSLEQRADAAAALVKQRQQTSGN